MRLPDRPCMRRRPATILVCPAHLICVRTPKQAVRHNGRYRPQHQLRRQQLQLRNPPPLLPAPCLRNMVRSESACQSAAMRLAVRRSCSTR